MESINCTNEKAGSLVEHHADIMGVLLTFYKTRSNLSRRVLDALKDIFGEKVFDTKIPENVKLSEAQESSKAVFDHDPKCSGAEAYHNLVKEVMGRLTNVVN